MLATTSLSVAANTLRSYLAANIADLDGIFISHPKEAAEQANSEGKQYLNLFFYQVEHGGYPADGRSDDPFYLRVNCLITPLGTKEPGPPHSSVSAGENDLRLIGEVLRLLHEQPLLMVEEGGEMAHLQVVMYPLSLDDINHLWSNQGEVAYRLSVAYQLSLLPIPLGVAKERSPLTGSIAIGSGGTMTMAPLPSEGFAMETAVPQITSMSVNTSRPDWTPQLVFLDERGRLQSVLSFSLLTLPVSLNIIILGQAGETVTLGWQEWNAGENHVPWRDVAIQQDLPAAADSVDQEQTEPSLASLATPISPEIEVAGQAVLSAERTWTRPDGSQVVLRSNPLLLIVYEEGA
jgi:hypothetical protein